ncbi:glycerol-3-phosphate dehydrogenase [Sphingomonas metalli]|uniref:Glycerol-3-phosphate dehydrogenase n=1 Tax=Sphingomonas metalli TaxID=1779358 RepID=A0A916WP34_9SPHN|nr:FAD-dependent oxidoreductase [Sphingomonas metalli]GGB16291.1 glycerol-3-phosphate dehydrogenase [Sphingomonas metalli]
MSDAARFDVAIVGAGMAGASLASALARHVRVLVLEAESQPGFHATGRSAAFWSETYGGPGVQPLTTASGPMLRTGGFLDPLGSLHLGEAPDRPKAGALLSAFAGRPVELTPVNPASLIPGLRPTWSVGVLEPSCAYIDVAALHAHYLQDGRRHGVKLVTGARLERASRTHGIWQVETSAGRYTAAILVNAAGAWADPVAAAAGVRPLGIRPYRRTMVQVRVDPPVPADLPHVVDLSGNFYFKPEAGGRLWVTPHDETLSAPCDAAPEEIDVALAIHRLERVVEWRVLAVERRWAGLRSFAADRLPVYGFDPAAPGFFWCAGQGGFGIQTAPAASMLAAALLLGRPCELAQVDADRYSPARFDAMASPSA